MPSTEAASPLTEAASLPRHNNFDFLRIVLAILVIWGHCPELLGTSEWSGKREILEFATHGQIYSGRLAVCGFFLISGFLISQSWERSQGLKDYFSKRVRRIYPGFVAASLLTACVFAPLGADSFSDYWHAFDPIHFLANLFFLNQPDAPPTFLHLKIHAANGSLWTIQAEFLCYILVAVLGVAGLLKRRAFVLVFTTLMLLVYWRTTIHMTQKIYTAPIPYIISFGQWLPNLVYFCIGMACVYMARTRVTTKIALAAFVLTVCASQFPPYGILFVLPFTLPILLLWTAYTPCLKMQDFAKKKGDLSYGIYVYAFPIQQCLIKFVPSLRHATLLFFAALLLTLPFAWLSWHLIESPFMRKRETEIASS